MIYTKQLFIYCLLFLGALTHAEPMTGTPWNIKINSADKHYHDLLDTSSRVEIITAEELQLLKCNRLSECLEFATGISSLNTEGDIFQTSTIRGNTLANYNTDTLLLIDGIPIRNPYHGSFNLDMIPLSAIDRIEILKGANSVLYGSNAMNGVINVITRDSSDDIYLLGRYGSFNTLHSEIGLIQNYTQGSLRLFADRSSSDGESFLIRDENNLTRDFAQDYETDALVVKADYKRLWLHLQFSDRHLGNYKTSGFEAGTPPQNALERNREFEYLGAFGFSIPIDRDFLLKLQSNYHAWSLNKRRYNGEWDYESWSLYNELELHMFEKSKSSNVLGISFEHSNARRYQSEINDYDVGKNDEDTHDVSLYDNGNYQLHEQLDLVYGGRLSFSSYHDPLLEEEIRNNNFSVRAGLIYSPLDRLALKLLYAQAYRTPSYLEKEVNSSIMASNSELEPETSESYDLILMHQLQQLHYTVDLYYTKIKNRIIPVDIGGGQEQYQNREQTGFYGLELNGKFTFNKGLYGFAGYAYTQSEQQKDKHLIYEHMLTLGLSQQASAALRFNAAFKYLDDWGEASDYFLANLSMEYQLPFVSGMSLEIIANNIFEEKIDLPEVSRESSNVLSIPTEHSTHYYMGLKYRF